MRTLIGLVLVVALLAGVVPGVAHAGVGVDVALGLASFAVFNQLFGGLYGYPTHTERVVIYAPPPVYVTPVPQVVYTSRPAVYLPPTPTAVEYPHGRYELRGDGVRVGYHWVWIPRVPPPPPPPDPPAPR
jgi:hypothetical protein